MRVFRKVVLPVAWVAIFATIAVSLAVMAFGNDDPEPPRSGLTPTGKIPVSNAGVSRGTIENTLTLRGTIEVDAPVTAKADHDGVVNHFFLPVGAKVKVGEPIFQVKSEETEAPTGDDEEEAKPQVRYYNVLATKAGRIASYAKELDDPVTKGDAVATVRLDTYRATGSIKPVDQYRLLHMPRSARVTITGGPKPFSCGDLAIGDPVTDTTNTGDGAGDAGQIDPSGYTGPGDGEGGEGGGGASIACRVPDDVRVFDGLAMTMSINAGRAEDVLVVPITAVRGVVGTGTVWVVTNGEPTPRRVRLGLSDGQNVEIRKGLKEGEEILEFVPGASPEDLNGDMGQGVG
ncbi:efflux RND transporter periplasmic adaptor subunit [Aeromicrobium ginsengisoli]|uniref:Efflux RND transporter periplasmic adaptor subunit n=1 Tax=Aeromicrobium ginsengisoli TaxID=363867 RepID=A0A5M4FDY0_9ACTN|nr:efflux RND transporter periplasmic adaptor subunit [Aeromicrobium ginsengisoli]KAA1397545.1 efflux RND transporter periplasmic adaptor subunit [Aeromicrobium ginsengisoli]